MTNAYKMDFVSKKRDKVNQLVINGIFSQNKFDVCRVASMKVKSCLQGVTGIEMNIYCRAAVGEDMGLLQSAQKVLEEGTMAVNHESNEVLLLVFWASWCKNSSPYMVELQKMAQSKKAQWGDKVRIIALSID